MSGQIAGWLDSDTGHVAEPAGREAQQHGVTVTARIGHVHQRGRRELGHVADHGNERVVHLGRDRDRFGAELGGQSLDFRERLGVGLLASE